MYVKDDKFKYIFANKSLKILSNKSVDEIIGKDDFEIYPISQAEKIRESAPKLVDVFLKII